MTKQSCAALTAPQNGGRGSPCKKPALAGGVFCSLHNPERPFRMGGPKGTRDDNDAKNLALAQRALLGEDCIVAVKKIAAGHGDPMTLCQNALNRFKNGEK